MRRRRTTKSNDDNSINIKELINKLSKVKPGLANKEITEQSTHFIFDGDKVWTYNDWISIVNKIDTNISGAIKAEEFFKLLTRIDDEKVKIDQEDSIVFLSSTEESKNNIKVKIKIDTKVKLKPIKLPSSDDKWEDLPEDFSQATLFSIFSASKNMNRPELTCLWLTGNHIISCDSFRGTKRKVKSKFKDTYLLPAEAAKELCKYDPKKIIQKDGWIHFTNDEETIFSCRTYTNLEYPETVWKFFEVDGNGVTLPKDFTKTISRAEVLVTEDFDLDRTVSLSIKDNTVKCKGEGALGEFEEESEIEYDGENIDIKVHPRLLSEILSKLTEMTVGERLLFKGENFEHAVCLSC